MHINSRIETQEDFTGWTKPSLGQYLHPSPIQSSRSIQRMQTVLVPKQSLYDELTVTKKETILMKLVFESHIKKLKKEILLGGPTPFQVSTYTHLLYKAQDPFSACRESWLLNKVLCTEICCRKLSKKEY